MTAPHAHALRVSLGLSRVDVGRWAGVSRTTVANYEGGERLCDRVREPLEGVYEALEILARAVLPREAA